MSLAQRIAFFESVREMPYYIGLNDNEINCNCVTKSELLGEKLATIGLKSRPILCTFDWTETPLPNDLLTLPRDPGETHQFLEVLIPETNQWIKCDPTWDSKLQPAGFPIATWDGMKDTILGVKPHKIYNAEETIRVMADENDPHVSAKHMVKHTSFYDGINKWLQAKRLG